MSAKLFNVCSFRLQLALIACTLVSVSWSYGDAPPPASQPAGDSPCATRIKTELASARKAAEQAAADGPRSPDGFMNPTAYSAAVFKYQVLVESLQDCDVVDAATRTAVLAEAGWITLKCENAKKGEEWLTKARTISPNDARILLRLAILQYRQMATSEDPENVRQVQVIADELRTAERQLPNSPDVHYMRALICHAQHDQAGADTQYTIVAKHRDEWDRELWLYDSARVKNLYDQIARDFGSK